MERGAEATAGVVDRLHLWSFRLHSRPTRPNRALSMANKESGISFQSDYKMDPL